MGVLHCMFSVFINGIGNFVGFAKLLLLRPVVRGIYDLGKVSHEGGST
jgi:Na+-transporting NADH:ubiquinone oxidoreductase subunit NqrD